MQYRFIKETDVTHQFQPPLGNESVSHMDLNEVRISMMLTRLNIRSIASLKATDGSVAKWLSEQEHTLKNSSDELVVFIRNNIFQKECTFLAERSSYWQINV